MIQEITVSGGSLDEPVEITFDAESGENIENDIELAYELGSGSDEVSLFIHVQYVDEATNRIINKSIPTLKVKN